MDTDSLIMYSLKRSLKDCVLPHKKEKYRELEKLIFADEMAATNQKNKFKLEGEFGYGEQSMQQ